MKENNLKAAIEVIEQINITAEMQREVIRGVKQQMSSKFRKRTDYRLRHLAAGAAIFALVICAVGVPVSAYVLSVVKERMDQIPEAEVKDIVQTIDEQPVEADSFSREYTETERARMKELQMAYRNGTFPEGELQQAESEAEAVQYDFCFLKSISRFYLPDRELTDEELLQIIDFNAKRDYGLQQRYEEEFADEIKARKEKEEAAKAKLRAQGGISEDEALETAKAWLHSIYGVTEDGREINSYLDSDSEPARYVITFSIQSIEYYYFNIDAADGSLLSVHYSTGKYDDVERQPVSVAKDEIQDIYSEAEKFLQEKLGIFDEYQHAYYFYYGDGEKLEINKIKMQFVKADGFAYLVDYHYGPRQIVAFEMVNYADYRELQANDEEWEKKMAETNGRSDLLNIDWVTVQLY